jgi:hypothetical protein
MESRRSFLKTIVEALKSTIFATLPILLSRFGMKTCRNWLTSHAETTKRSQRKRLTA